MIQTCADICHDSYGSGIGFRDVGDLRYGLTGDGILVFRGTANAHNVLRDLQFLPVRSRGGYLVHRGFQSAVDRIYQSVCHKVPISRRADLIVTGHSLGGAMALLFAEVFGCRAVTFGCPRVHWRWDALPDIRHDRIICDDDPVPMVPRLLYRHTCEPAGVLRDRDGDRVDARDHCIAVYCERLRRQACAG